MTCEDCLHYELCRYNTFQEAHYFGKDKKIYITINNNLPCKYFADRSEWVHLPCKKGDKVYYIYQDPKTCKYSIHQREIYLTGFNNNHFCFYATPSICFKDTEFGKSVFLTREKAKKALEEKEIMNKCECYFEQEVVNPCGYDTRIVVGRCNGTKERDECQCEGDLSKCDFYPEVRDKL